MQSYESAVPADMWQRILKEKEKHRKVAWWKTKMGFIGASILGLSLLLLGLYNYLPNSAGKSLSSKQAVKSHSIAKERPINGGSLPASILPQGKINRSNQIDKTDGYQTTVGRSQNLKTVIISSTLNASLPPGKEIAKLNVSSFAMKQNISKWNKTKLNIGSSTLPIQQTQPEEQLLLTRLVSPYLSVRTRPSIQNLKMGNNLSVLGSHNKIDCPKAGDLQTGDWYIEVFGSPDWAVKKTTLNRGNNNAFLQKKDSSQAGQLSFTAGFRFTKELGENMVFKTGLQYSQINEKFTNRTENERRLTTVITTRTIIGSNGQPFTVIDTSVTELIGYSQKTTYNKYCSIDIPLLLGYVVALNGWQLGFTGGPILNFRSWQEGEALDTNLQPVVFSKNKTTVYKRNTGFGLFAGLSINKYLSMRTSIFAEPYFRYNLSSLTNSTSIVNEKYKITGVLLGVRYNLSNSKATH